MYIFILRNDNNNINQMMHSIYICITWLKSIIIILLTQIIENNDINSFIYLK